MADGGDGAMRSHRGGARAGALVAAVLLTPATAAAQTLPDLPWLAPSPHLVIGANASDPSDDLFRVAGVAEMPGGRIAVVNAGTREVLVFGRDGRRVCVAGRRGDGPGEFPSTPALVPAQRYDSLFVESLPRLSVVRGDCSVRPVGQVDVLQQVLVTGVLPGAFVLARHDGRPEAARRQVGPRISTLDLYVTGALPELGRRAGGVEYHVYYNVTPVRGLPIPLTVPASVAVADGLLLITDGVSPFVISLAPPAFREVRIPIPLSREPVTARQFAAALAERSPEHRDALRDAPRPEWRPLVHRLVADGAGGFWAELFDPASDGGTRWLAYDGRGTPLGIVRTPPGLHVWQVGPDFLLGVAKDEWGEERVERYALRRSGGGVGR